MVVWSKSADWIPLSNAQAQVAFWESDLQYSKQYLEYVVSHKKSGFSFWSKAYFLAVKDVKESIKELAKARAKLVESEQLELIFRSH